MLGMLHVPLPGQKPQSNNGQSIFQISSLNVKGQMEPMWTRHGQQGLSNWKPSHMIYQFEFVTNPRSKNGPTCNWNLSQAFREFLVSPALISNLNVRKMYDLPMLLTYFSNITLAECRSDRCYVCEDLTFARLNMAEIDIQRYWKVRNQKY